MKTTPEQFRTASNKTVTLLGMSGVGKTTLASVLPTSSWFHYSGDYRIGTKYLDEPILDLVKQHAMHDDFLRGLLLSDSIYIRNNITIDHLQPISSFLGKIGNPDLGGLPVDEFKRRQGLFRAAEVNAMQDVGEFITKIRKIYGYPHFLNDAGGSICSLGKEECWEALSNQTVVLYLRADEDLEHTLIERSQRRPKPLFYEEAFLDQHLAEFIELNSLKSAEEIVPNEFVQWIFPKLISHRRPQYERLAEQYGHAVDAAEILSLRDEQDFIDLVCDAAAS